MGIKILYKMGAQLRGRALAWHECSSELNPKALQYKKQSRASNGQTKLCHHLSAVSSPLLLENHHIPAKSNTFKYIECFKGKVQIR